MLAFDGDPESLQLTDTEQVNLGSYREPSTVLEAATAPRGWWSGVAGGAAALSNHLTAVLESWVDYHKERVGVWNELVGVTIECVETGSSDIDAPRTNGGYDEWRSELAEGIRGIADAACGLLQLCRVDGRALCRRGRVRELLGQVWKVQNVERLAQTFARRQWFVLGGYTPLDEFVQTLRIDALLAIETWNPMLARLSSWVISKWRHTATKAMRALHAWPIENQPVIMAVDPWPAVDSRYDVALRAGHMPRRRAEKIEGLLRECGPMDELARSAVDATPALESTVDYRRELETLGYRHGGTARFGAGRDYHITAAAAMAGAPKVTRRTKSVVNATARVSGRKPQDP